MDDRRSRRLSAHLERPRWANPEPGDAAEDPAGVVGSSPGRSGLSRSRARRGTTWPFTWP